MAGKTVLLYGNSIFLNGLAVEIEAAADFRIGNWQRQATPIDFWDVDVVVVDLAEHSLHDLLAQVVAPAAVRFVGINATGNRVTVLTRNTHQTHTLEDVLGCL